MRFNLNCSLMASIGALAVVLPQTGVAHEGLVPHSHTTVAPTTSVIIVCLSLTAIGLIIAGVRAFKAKK